MVRSSGAKTDCLAAAAAGLYKAARLGHMTHLANQYPGHWALDQSKYDIKGAVMVLVEQCMPHSQDKYTDYE